MCGGIIIPKGNDVCDGCKTTFQRIIQPKCMKCGKPIEQREQEYCFDCSKTAFCYTRGISLWVYDRNVRKSIAAHEGVQLKDDTANGVYPMPLDTSNQNDVFVGRIREDLTDDNGLCLWCCGDQIRKGAATNAVQIAELL